MNVRAIEPMRDESTYVSDEDVITASSTCQELSEQRTCSKPRSGSDSPEVPCSSLKSLRVRSSRSSASSVGSVLAKHRSLLRELPHQEVLQILDEPVTFCGTLGEIEEWEKLLPCSWPFF